MLCKTLTFICQKYNADNQYVIKKLQKEAKKVAKK